MRQKREMQRVPLISENCIWILLMTEVFNETKEAAIDTCDGVCS